MLMIPGSPDSMEKKTEGNRSAFAPWADLPDSLAESILVLLPAVDYIRFAAVCRGWQSIQREHRRRHSPFPPPTTHPLPWLLSYNLHKNNGGGGEERGLLEAYSPLEKKHYRLPLPSGLQSSDNVYRYVCSHGWLLMASHEPRHRSLSLPSESIYTGRYRFTNFDSKLILTEPFLFNPVTCATIPLPPLSINNDYGHLGALSAPPTDPECAVLFFGANGIFLHRLRGDGGWKRVRHAARQLACSAIACGGKFYCHYHPTAVGVIDPLLPQPTMQYFELDLGMPSHVDWNLRSVPSLQQMYCLVENDGEVCIVMTSKLDLTTIKEFRVYRADLYRKEWVRMETLGDRVMFIDRRCSLSLVAADVGFKKNTIYCGQYSWDDDGTCLWRAFDLDTGDWIAGTPVSYLEVGHRSSCNLWFMPDARLGWQHASRPAVPRQFLELCGETSSAPSIPQIMWRNQ